MTGPMRPVPSTTYTTLAVVCWIIATVCVLAFMGMCGGAERAAGYGPGDAAEGSWGAALFAAIFTVGGYFCWKRRYNRMA